MTIQIDDDRHGAHGRYRLLADGVEVGELDYRDADGRRTFTHTGVRTSHQGRGLAAQLVRRALDDARAEQLAVVPRCSYVAAYLAEHPEDVDLLPRAD